MSWGLKSLFMVLGFGFVLALAALGLQVVVASGRIENPDALFGGAVLLIPAFAVVGWPVMLFIVKSNQTWPTDVIRTHGFILSLLNVLLLMLALSKGGGIQHIDLWCMVFGLLPIHLPVFEWACALAALAAAVMGIVRPWPNT